MIVPIATVWVCDRFSRLVSALPIVPPRVPPLGMPTMVRPWAAVRSIHPVGHAARLKYMIAPFGTLAHSAARAA